MRLWWRHWQCVQDMTWAAVLLTRCVSDQRAAVRLTHQCPVSFADHSESVPQILSPFLSFLLLNLWPCFRYWKYGRSPKAVRCSNKAQIQTSARISGSSVTAIYRTWGCWFSAYVPKGPRTLLTEILIVWMLYAWKEAIWMVLKSCIQNYIMAISPIIANILHSESQDNIIS